VAKFLFCTIQELAVGVLLYSFYACFGGFSISLDCTFKASNHANTLKIPWQTFGKVGKPLAKFEVALAKFIATARSQPVLFQMPHFWPVLLVLSFSPRSFQVSSAHYFANVVADFAKVLAKFAIGKLVSKNGSITLFSMVFSFNRSHPKGNFATLPTLPQYFFRILVRPRSLSIFNTSPKVLGQPFTILSSAGLPAGQLCPT
jgi:hypothetical protein